MERPLGRFVAVLLLASGGMLVASDVGTALAYGRTEATRAFRPITIFGADSTKDAIQSPKDYFDFLGFLAHPDTAEGFARSVVRRHLNALSIVLPERMVKRLQIEKGAETGRVQALADGAGRDLTRWWRRRNPYPATPYNERLREHLQRTTEAFEKYSREDNPDRLDDRGRVYIRFGPPDRKRELDIGHEGEFWVYASHSAAEYVFVRDRGDGYKLAPPTDILPERLRRGFGPSTRGLRKAVRSLTMLERVYERLAHFRSRYGITFSDLSMYKEQVRQAMDGLPTSFSVRPHTFARQKIQEIQHEEAEATQRRKEVLPRTQSDVGSEFEEIPIAARWVRSLTEAGSTEVALYWSVPRASLRPSGERVEALRERSDGRRGYLLSTSLVQFSESYERQNVHTRHLFASEDRRAAGTLDPRRTTFRLEDTSHAALQVDVAWATLEDESESVRPRAKLKVGTSRVDSLKLLNNDPSVLEMSDLRPALLRTDSTSVEEAPVYPFRKLPPAIPLALRFELYHLSTDAAGRTQYTVEYEVLRRTDRGGLARLLRGDEQERTAVKSRVEGRAPRTTEFVLLDPANWVREETQTVRITVEVTDERTGEQVSRAVEFDLPPKSG